MNIALWVLQILLALHTAIGAVWKFSNPPEKTMPSLGVIPQPAWLGMSVVELLASVALVVPLLHEPWAIAVPVAALVIAAEMLLFTALHLASGDKSRGPMVYWLVVAALCAFVAYGRLQLAPL